MLFINGIEETYFNVQQLRAIGPNALLLLLLLVACVLLTISRLINAKRISEIFIAAVNNNLAFQQFRNQQHVLSIEALCMHAVFVLVLSVLLFETNKIWAWFDSSSSEQLVLLSIFGLALLYFFRLISLWLVAKVTEMDDELLFYRYNIVTINHLFAMCALPVALVLVCNSGMLSDLALYGSIVLFSAASVYKLLRGVMILMKRGFDNLSHIILYICTLEIAPMLILWHVLLA